MTYPMYLDIEGNDQAIYVHCVKCVKQVMEVDPENYETPVCDYCREVKV